MKIDVLHEGFIYSVENYDDNKLMRYKYDIDEWMGDIEYIKVFTIEGETPNSDALYRKLSKSTKQIIAATGKDWYMFSVTDEKRADLYERFINTINGFTTQRADKWFYLYKIQ
tara:strand:- start:390 stop:728 length:339 start_codon:yes stop_codon:yes gene_type:complete